MSPCAGQRAAALRRFVVSHQDPFGFERSDVLANNETVLISEVGVVLEVGDPVTKLLTSSLSNSPRLNVAVLCLYQLRL